MSAKRTAAKNWAHLNDEQFGAFHSAVGRLLQSIQADPAMHDLRELVVATLLSHRMIEKSGDVAAISHSEICLKTGWSLSTVQRALRRLAMAGYFQVVRPSKSELDEGGWTLEYRPQFEAGASFRHIGFAA